MAKATPAKKTTARKAVEAVKAKHAVPAAATASAKPKSRPAVKLPDPRPTKVAAEVERTRKLHERRDPAERKEQLMVVLGKQINKGMVGLKRAAIAEAANVSTGLVTKYLGSVADTEKLAMELAHKAGNHKAIAKCVKDGYPLANLPRNVQAKLKAL